MNYNLLLLVYLQGYHYLCKKCGNSYFKTQWLVRRHLQDVHTGLQYQCTLCTHTYQRKNLRHGCEATERDFVLFHLESGDKGPAAQRRLDNFVRNIVPYAWRYVPKKGDTRDNTPGPSIRSVCVHPSRNEKLERQQRRKEAKKEKGTNTKKPLAYSPVRCPTSKSDHKEEDTRGKKRPSASSPSPAPLGDDPQIEITEAPPVFSPPVKVQRTDPDYVASLEELTERARLATVNVEKQVVTTAPNSEDEAATRHLQDLLDGITRCHATEAPGQAVTNFTSYPTPEDIEHILHQVEDMEKEDEKKRREEEEAEAKRHEEERKKEERQREEEKKQKDEEVMKRQKEEKQREEKRQKEEERKIRHEEEERKKQEKRRQKEEKRQRDEDEMKKQKEERRKEEKVQKEEMKKKKQEEKARREREEEEKQRRKEEDEVKKREEEDKQRRKEEDEEKKREEEKQRRKEEDEAKRREEEEQKRKEEDEKQRREEEKRQRQEEERQRQEEEDEKQRREEEQRRKQEVEDERRQEELRKERKRREEEERLNQEEEERLRRVEEESLGREEERRKEDERKERKRQKKEKRKEKQRKQEEEEESRQREKEERQRQRKERKRKQEEEERRLHEETRCEESSQGDEHEDPIVTGHDLRAMIREGACAEVEGNAQDKVTLNVGGRHFATSRRTLLSQPNSLFHSLMKEERSHYDIDRDGGHFRYILNYLRSDGLLSLASLPRENRYLLELKNECIYYHLPELEELIAKRLEMYHILGIAF